MEFENLLTEDVHEAGAEMEIKDPATGEKTGAFLLIKGVDSKTFRAALTDYNRKRLDPKADQEAMSIDLLVAATDGWRGIKEGGADKAFSKDAVRTLYAKSPAIRQQADGWIADRRNFTKG